eukprot:509965-Amphidinium_carterae.2
MDPDEQLRERVTAQAGKVTKKKSRKKRKRSSSDSSSDSGGSKLRDSNKIRKFSAERPGKLAAMCLQKMSEYM